MKKNINWKQIIFIIGVIALIIGIVDPLEGSVVILAGSVLVALSTLLMKDRHWKIFLASFILILLGVFFIFYLSSLGGFGGTSKISIWWGLLIVPYPIGWLIDIVVLIVKALKRLQKTSSPIK
jgi:hypothetical protein